jgi:hypothetical protein
MIPMSRCVRLPRTVRTWHRIRIPRCVRYWRATRRRRTLHALREQHKHQYAVMRAAMRADDGTSRGEIDRNGALVLRYKVDGREVVEIHS